MEMSSKLIEAGWAETDITPQGLPALSGQYYHRKAESIHSRLKATALALGSETGESAIIVSVDTAAVPRSFQERVRDRAGDLSPDINRENIFLTATHTHSAPALSSIRVWWLKDESSAGEDDDYGDFACERIAQAVVQAWKTRRPGITQSASCTAVTGHCRRTLYRDGHSEMYGCASRPDFIGMESGEDSTIELLVTYTEDGKPTGLILNAACPSQIMESTYRISSDYMGRVREGLKDIYGEEFRTLCLVGAAGCQSPRDLVRMRDSIFWSEQGVEIAGERIVQSVQRAIGKIDSGHGVESVFLHRKADLRLSRRPVSKLEFEKAENDLARLSAEHSVEDAFEMFCGEVRKNEAVPGRPGPYDSKLHPFVLMMNAEAVLKRHREWEKNPGFEMELHSVRIGNTALVTCPFELFLDYGHRIKARSCAARTMIAQLACDHAGYLPTRTAEEHGGYGALIINGEVGSRGGDELVEASLNAVADLF